MPGPRGRPAGRGPGGLRRRHPRGGARASTLASDGATTFASTWGRRDKVVRSMRPGGHLVLVSSAAVYGSGRGEVTAATAPRPDTFPVPPYAWAKLAAEHAARAGAADRGLSLTILRPSIIYGPGAGGVLITLRDMARRGVRVELLPSSTRQHLLHVRLFQRILEAAGGRAAAGAAGSLCPGRPVRGADVRRERGVRRGRSAGRAGAGPHRAGGRGAAGVAAPFAARGAGDGGRGRHARPRQRLRIRARAWKLSASTPANSGERASTPSSGGQRERRPCARIPRTRRLSTRRS